MEGGRAAGCEFKLSQGRAGRARANLAVYCDHVSVLDEFVFERTGDIDTDVVQLPVPFVLFTVEVSDAKFARKEHHRYESSITCSRRLFLPLFLTLIPEPPQDLT